MYIVIVGKFGSHSKVFLRTSDMFRRNEHLADFALIFDLPAEQQTAPKRDPPGLGHRRQLLQGLP